MAGRSAGAVCTHTHLEVAGGIALAGLRKPLPLPTNLANHWRRLRRRQFNNIIVIGGVATEGHGPPQPTANQPTPTNLANIGAVCADANLIMLLLLEVVW